MKKLILLFVLLPLFSFSQKFISNNSEFLDFEKNEINIIVEKEKFNGTFEYIKVSYMTYILITNSTKTLILDYGISKPSKNSMDFYIENVTLINSIDLISLKKIVAKNSSLIHKNINIVYEGKNDVNKYGLYKDYYKPYWGEKFTSVAYLEKLKKINEAKETRAKEYDSITELQSYIGTYRILISTYHGVKVTNQEAKLIITDEGISILTDLESTGALRGAHKKSDDVFKPEKGAFYCSTSTSPWTTLIFSISENAGAVTSSFGKTYRTSTFIIKDKQ